MNYTLILPWQLKSAVLQSDAFSGLPVSRAHYWTIIKPSWWVFTESKKTQQRKHLALTPHSRKNFSTFLSNIIRKVTSLFYVITMFLQATYQCGKDIVIVFCHHPHSQSLEKINKRLMFLRPQNTFLPHLHWKWNAAKEHY